MQQRAVSKSNFNDPKPYIIFHVRVICNRDCNFDDLHQALSERFSFFCSVVIHHHFIISAVVISFAADHYDIQFPQQAGYEVPL
jgi:hypothetical protein